MNFVMDSDMSKMAIQHYGKSNQVLKLIEELHELSEVLQFRLVGESVTDNNELHAMIRRTRANLDSIRTIKTRLAGTTSNTAFETADEFADCLLMIFQGIYIFNCRDLIQERILVKESEMLSRIVFDIIIED